MGFQETEPPNHIRALGVKPDVRFGGKHLYLAESSHLSPARDTCDNCVLIYDSVNKVSVSNNTLVTAPSKQGFYPIGVSHLIFCATFFLKKGRKERRGKRELEKC